jgi:hypothetical protein
MSHLCPVAYHVADNNRFGLDLLRQRINRTDVVFHCCAVRSLEPPAQADVVFSLGLIEHFDPETTRDARAGPPAR